MPVSMRLADWLQSNGKTATWLASQVGRDRSFITKVKNGEALPSVEVAADIQRLTGGEVTAIDYFLPVDNAVSTQEMSA